MLIAEAIINALAFLAGILIIERAFTWRRHQRDRDLHEREMKRRDAKEANLLRRIDDYQLNEDWIIANFHEVRCLIHELDKTTEKKR